jgi:hypothetical protein
MVTIRSNVQDTFDAGFYGIEIDTGGVGKTLPPFDTPRNLLPTKKEERGWSEITFGIKERRRTKKSKGEYRKEGRKGGEQRRDVVFLRREEETVIREYE